MKKVDDQALEDCLQLAPIIGRAIHKVHEESLASMMDVLGIEIKHKSDINLDQIGVDFIYEILHVCGIDTKGRIEHAGSYH